MGNAEGLSPDMRCDDYTFHFPSHQLLWNLTGDPIPSSKTPLSASVLIGGRVCHCKSAVGFPWYGNKNPFDCWSLSKERGNYTNEECLQTSNSSFPTPLKLPADVCTALPILRNSTGTPRLLLGRQCSLRGAGLRSRMALGSF